MNDLTHYPNRNTPALWITFPEHRDALMWVPKNFSDPGEIGSFTAAGWEDAGPVFDTALFILSGQLAGVRIIETDADHSNIWTAKEDRERVKRLPVILAFKIPPHYQKEAEKYHREAEQGKNLSFYIDSPHALPPSSFGELALIRVGEGDAGQWVCCSISKLPDKSQQLQQHMGKELLRLSVARTLASDLWKRRWKEIQHMAQQLAADYLRAYINTQNEPPYVPNVFQDGFAWIGLNMGLRGTQAAINAHNHWKTKEPGVLPYHDSQYENSHVRVSLQNPAQTSIDADLASGELLRRLASLDDLTADIVRIQIAQALASDNGHADAILTPEAILEYRGIQPMRKPKEHNRDAGQRTEDRSAVIKAFENTAWLRLKVSQSLPHKKLPIEVESAYVLIKEWVYQPTLDDSPRRLLAWRYQMGTWLAPFLDESEAGKYFGVLMKRTLEYNLKDELLEKRLSGIFAIQLLIAAKHGAASCKFFVGKLIDECAMSIDRRNPQRTKERFEKALDQLASDGIIGDWKYTSNSPLPARQWLEDWRGRTIVVTLGELALRAYQQMIEDAKARSKPAKALPTPQNAERPNRYKHT